MKPLKVAFLGARHPHVFSRLALCQAEEGVTVTGLFDNDRGITQTISQQYDVPAASNLEELLSEPDLDLIVVDGFDYENPAYVEKAAGHCRMLLIEKPGAPKGIGCGARGGCRLPLHRPAVMAARLRAVEMCETSTGPRGLVLLCVYTGSACRGRARGKLQQWRSSQGESPSRPVPDERRANR